MIRAAESVPRIAAFTPSETVLMPSISSPLSVSSRTARRGLRSINCRISNLFFSPPLNPSLTYLDMNERGISRDSIAEVNSSLNTEPFASSSPLMLATDFLRKLPTCRPGTACGYWKERKTPFLALSHASNSSRLSPSRITSPFSTSKSGCPIITFAVVVFPLPFLPMIA